MPNVSNLVKTIQDIMRKDAGTYGDAQRLEQLGWMFFLKIFDDREMQLELFQDDYRSPLPKNLRWRNWAADEEGITGDALLDFIDNSLLPKLKSLSGSDKMSTLIRMAFEDANNYMKNGTLMRQVINKVNGIDFNVSDDRHLFGDIYEKLLKDLQSAGSSSSIKSIQGSVRPSSIRPVAPEAFWCARLSTCASKPKPRPTSAPSKIVFRGLRRSICRTCCA
jgi:type I restriction enzyme M protein